VCVEGGVEEGVQRRKREEEQWAKIVEKRRAGKTDEWCWGGRRGRRAVCVCVEGMGCVGRGGE